MNSSSLTRHPMFAFHDDFEEIDWTAYLIEQYLQVIVTSPLLVHDTLLSVQYQQRIEQEEFENIHHDNKTQSLYFPRLNADFIASFRMLLDTKNAGFTIYLRGHFTHFLHQTLYNTITPFIEVSIIH
jgi:hypothetical protein